jgi:hypothetical protein
MQKRQDSVHSKAIIRTPHPWHMKTVGGHLPGRTIDSSQEKMPQIAAHHYQGNRKVITFYRNILFTNRSHYCILWVHESITDEDAWYEAARTL